MFGYHEQPDICLENRLETLHLLRDCANALRDHDKHALALGLDDLMKELSLV